MAAVEVAALAGDGLAAALPLLEESLRDGEPVPSAFAEQLRESVERGEVEVLAARFRGSLLGVAVLAYRLNVSAGTRFASIEDLYVRPDARRRGIGRTLLETAEKRCAARGISYVEVQVEEDGAEVFYSALGYAREPGVRVLSRSHAL